MRESERGKVGIEKDTVRECGEKEVTIKERKVREREREKGRERDRNCKFLSNAFVALKAKVEVISKRTLDKTKFCFRKLKNWQ